MNNESVIIGLGEVGRPLEQMMHDSGQLPYTIDIRGLDLPPGPEAEIKFMHICFPETPNFRESVYEYAKQWKPSHIIIHSSVTPGTSDQIQHWVDGIGLGHSTRVYYSPVRGNMRDGMLHGLKEYTKYIGAVYYDSQDEAERAEAREVLNHMEGLGFKVSMFEGVEGLEWAKSLDLLLYALDLVGAQLIERFLSTVVNHNPLAKDGRVLERREFEDLYLPVSEFIKTTPTESDGKVQRTLYYGGHIGGHCVIQAVERLLPLAKDEPTRQILRGILESNILRHNELLNGGFSNGKPGHHP